MINKIFKGRKVLITGHTGFKGSWLALWLNKMGAKIIGVSLKDLRPQSHFNYLNLRTKLSHILLILEILKRSKILLIKVNRFHISSCCSSISKKIL